MKMKDQKSTQRLTDGLLSILMVSVIILISTWSQLNAQVCETEVKDGPHSHLKNPDLDYALRLVIWKVADDNGNGTVSDEEILHTLSNSVGPYNEHGLFFDLIEIKTVKKSAFLHNPNFLIYDGYNEDAYVENALNYYLVHPQHSAYAGAAAGKSGDFGRAWGFLDDQTGSGFVFCHELGHNLGLKHTFEGHSCYKDCDSTGDYVCDTPPDPYVKQVDQSPQVVGSVSYTHLTLPTKRIA